MVIIYFLLLSIQATLKNLGLITMNVSNIIFTMITIAFLVIRFDLIKKLKIRSKKEIE